MPKLANKVKFGLSNVHYALLTTDQSGNIVFGAPKPIPGAVSLSMTPQGETNQFYADNVAYYVAVANSGYQGDLEIALVPDPFAQDVLKESMDETGKVLLENSSAETAPFALLFQFNGDQHGVRHVLYNCTAARPNVVGSTTTNTKEPQTSSLSITAAPLADGGVKAKTTADTPDSVYNSWYTQVWRPGAAEVV